VRAEVLLGAHQNELPKIVTASSPILQRPLAGSVENLTHSMGLAKIEVVFFSKKTTPFQNRQ
jgi:hypothetical protein